MRPVRSMDRREGQASRRIASRPVAHEGSAPSALGSARPRRSDGGRRVLTLVRSSTTAAAGCRIVSVAWNRSPVTWSYRTSTTSSGRSGSHSPLRSVLQRLDAQVPLKPRGTGRARSFRVSARPLVIDVEVKPTCPAGLAGCIDRALASRLGRFAQLRKPPTTQSEVRKRSTLIIARSPLSDTCRPASWQNDHRRAACREGQGVRRHQRRGDGPPLRRGYSEGDDEPWAYGFDFVKQPPSAYLNFAGVRAFVQPSLAARLELENA